VACVVGGPAPGLGQGGLGARICLAGGPAAPSQTQPGGAGASRLGPVECRRGGQRPPLVCVAVAPPGRAGAAPGVPLALGAPEAARPPRADGICGLCQTCDSPGKRRAGGWQPLDHGTGFCRGERRGWSGPVRGAQWDRLVSSYPVGDGGICPVARLAGCQPAARGGTPKNAVPAPIEPPRGRQGDPRARVPLRVCDIRRLFWGLVLAIQQRVERILAWSTWRRWHQSIAHYWHYKRRAVA